MRMREDRRNLSSSCVGLGRGERERDVDLELCPDLADLTGIWILLDSLRETADADPPELDQAIGGELTLGGGFLGLVVSEVGELLRFCLSLGKVCCRRSEAGLDEVDAVGGGTGDEINESAYEDLHSEGAVKPRTLTRGTITRILHLGFVFAVGASVSISIRSRQGIAEIGGLEGEGLLESIRTRTGGNITSSPPGVAVFLRLIHLRSFSQLFLEEGGDEVDNALELLVTLLLSILEPAGDMTLDKGHRHSV